MMMRAASAGDIAPYQIAISGGHLGEPHKDAVTAQVRDPPWPGSGSKAWLHVRMFESPLDNQVGWPGRYIHVRRCGGLSMVILQLNNPLEKGNFSLVLGFYLVVIWPIQLLKVT